MSFKLPLPDSSEVRSCVAHACELAGAGDLRTAQKKLKELVARGALPAAAQREIIASWSAGYFVFDTKTVDKELEQVASQATDDSTKSVEESTQFEKQITRVMRERGLSHELALNFVLAGGADIEGPGGLAETDGEVTEEGLRYLLEQVAMRAGFPSGEAFTDGATFIDLGSGKGRCVLAAAQIWSGLRTSVGVEMIHSRHAEALKRLEDSNSDIKERVRLIHGDFFEVPWSRLATAAHDPGEVRRLLVLANTLCFGDALQAQLLRHLENNVGREDEIFVFCSGWPLLGPHFRREHAIWYEGPISVNWVCCGISFQVSWLPPMYGALHLDAWEAIVRNPPAEPHINPSPDSSGFPMPPHGDHSLSHSGQGTCQDADLTCMD